MTSSYCGFGIPDTCPSQRVSQAVREPAGHWVLSGASWCLWLWPPQSFLRGYRHFPETPGCPRHTGRPLRQKPTWSSSATSVRDRAGAAVPALHPCVPPHGRSISPTFCCPTRPTVQPSEQLWASERAGTRPSPCLGSAGTTSVALRCWVGDWRLALPTPQPWPLPWPRLGQKLS